MEKRVCNSICKKFKVKKPANGSRYGSGQGRCQTCDVWIDYRGAHMKDRSPATIDSRGWFCNCCNYRIRQKPRNKVYKEKLHEQSKQSQEVIKETAVKKDKESEDEFKKQFDYEKIEPQLVKEHNGNQEFFEGIKNQKEIMQNEQMYGHCILLTKSYKKRTISKHNIELMEDMINAYLELGSLEKICQEAGLDESKIRADFKNLIRVPDELRQLVLEDKLTADPILSTEIAFYATDYFVWDQNPKKTKDVIKFAKEMAELFKNSLELRKEFFATKDD